MIRAGVRADMGAADDWWITLPASRRAQIHRWITTRRNRRQHRITPGSTDPNTAAGQQELFTPNEEEDS